MAEGGALLVYSAPVSGAQDPWMGFLPIGLGCLQAALGTRGFPCRLANLTGLSKPRVIAYLRQRRPTLVGVSMFTFNRKRSADLLAWAREACPEALLVAGGPHPTHLAHRALADIPALDAVVRGEGERPLLALMEALAQDPRGDADAWRRAPGLVHRLGETPPPPPLDDLDALGLPVEHFQADFFHEPEQLGYLSTSRGCPGSCAFCNTPSTWGRRVRFRSPASVLREMALLRERHGLIYFSFRDDTFTTRKDRTLELMKGIRASGAHPLWNCQSRVNLVDLDRLVAMVRSGCEFIQFGVEHASPRVLASLDKGIRVDQARSALADARKVGLNVGIYLITGIPGEEPEDVQASWAFVQQTRPHDVQVSPLALYPGTKLYDQCLAEGRIPEDFLSLQGDAELFARKDAAARRGLRTLERAAQEAQQRARYTPEEFRAQRAFLGFCAVTNLLCGEAAEETGRPLEAEAQYAEIIRKEPRNPWGHLKRALLWLKQGQIRKGEKDLQAVLDLAPGNPEVLGIRETWGLGA